MSEELSLRTDLALCQQVREEPAGSATASEAFTELYLRYYDAAMGVAYRLLSDRHRAEEAVAEAFVKTLRVLQNGNGPTDSFLGYLLAAVRSESLRVPAIERVTDQVESEDLEQLPTLKAADPLDSFAERDQLVRAFAVLPEQWRRVLYLLEVEELAPSVAAEKLGVSEQAIWSLAFRAREALRNAYLQQYVDSAGQECASTAELLAEYVRGALRLRKRSRVRAHVDGCEACEAQASRLARINQGLKIWIGPLIIATGLNVGLIDREAASQAAPAGQVLRHGKTSKVLVSVGAGLSAAAVAAGALMFVWGAGSGLGPTPEQLEPAGVAGSSAQQADGAGTLPDPGTGAEAGVAADVAAEAGARSVTGNGQVQMTGGAAAVAGSPLGVVSNGPDDLGDLDGLAGPVNPQPTEKETPQLGDEGSASPEGSENPDGSVGDEDGGEPIPTPEAPQPDPGSKTATPPSGDDHTPGWVLVEASNAVTE